MAEVVGGRGERAQPPKGFDINFASEVQLNHYLRETLGDFVLNRGLVAGFDTGLISCTSSGAEFRNYDGTKLQKKPDIHVRLVATPAGVRPSQYGIFIECKPVDKTHPLASHYHAEGSTLEVPDRGLSAQSG